MPAHVVYDPYWDPVDSFAHQEEAEQACRPGGKHAGCHVVFQPGIEPGQHHDLPYVQPPWQEDQRREGAPAPRRRWGPLPACLRHWHAQLTRTRWSG